MRYFNTLFLALIFSNSAFCQTLPSDFSDVVLYLESDQIVDSLHISHCETQFCLNHPNSEAAPIIEQYCDLNVCPDGCVRRWPDLSPYQPSNGFNPPEYTNGRDFGQDDPRKPCFIPNGINGKPSVKGGDAFNLQEEDRILEMEVADIIQMPDDFSVYLMCKPIDQSQTTGDWFYFGQATTFMRHSVSDNALLLRVNGDSPMFQLSTDNSVTLDEWQLIEIHRDVNDSITCLINGQDVTNSPTAISGTFRVGYLFSCFKTTGVSMHGEAAAFMIYERPLNAMEQQDMYNHLESNYAIGLPSTLTVSESQLKPSIRYLGDNRILVSNIQDASAKTNSIELYSTDGKLIPFKQEQISENEQELILESKPQLLHVRIVTSEAVYTVQLSCY